MRSGQNPAKFIEKPAKRPERITVAILTHIPHLHGYYKDSLAVLKVSLATLREHTEQPYDLLIFDNASGAEARDYLQLAFDDGRIDYLILSRNNVGKGKAWDILLNAAPGEIIAYADSDVYFKQGWLTRGVRLLETFPKVGMVTCRPMRTYPDGYSASLAWAEQETEAVIEQGDFISWETFREHDIGLGQDEQDVRARYESTHDLSVRYHGEQALLGAAHWQFIAFTEVLREFLPLGIDRPLGDDRKLDDSLNQAGYLRLMTPEPLVLHLGNKLPKYLVDFHPRDASELRRGNRWFHRFLDWSPMRTVLLGIYNRIFRWYFNR